MGMPEMRLSTTLETDRPRRAIADAADKPAWRTRPGWVLLGHAFVGLGIVGAFLPLMPTTVFILLAATCYGRGSRHFYERLLTHRVFGPVVRDWRQHRAMTGRAKCYASAMIVFTMSISGVLVASTVARVILAVIGVALIAMLFLIPTRRSDAP